MPEKKGGRPVYQRKDGHGVVIDMYSPTAGWLDFRDRPNKEGLAGVLEELKFRVGRVYLYTRILFDNLQNS